MLNTSEVIDITGYPLIPLEKNADGHYPFPRERYGILPYHINQIGQIIWGCIESDRVGPRILAPAAGTQDIIAIKDDQRLVFESGKPFPDINVCGAYKGQLFRDQLYQDALECLVINGFSLYLENPLATATHEAYEELGIDLRKTNGRDRHLLNTALESSPHVLIPGQVGVIAPLCVWLPELTACDGIILRHTDKIDTKMRRNFGRKFYEQGCWLTLEYFKTQLTQERVRFSILNTHTPVEIELITEAFIAFDLNLKTLENIELTLRTKPHQTLGDQLENPDVVPSKLSAIHMNPNAFFNQTSGAAKLPMGQNESRGANVGWADKPSV